jgi:hypothetical protein
MPKTAEASLPNHNVAAGNIIVVQNDSLNNTNSVTTSLAVQINDFRLRGTGGPGDDHSPLQSRGDYAVQIGNDAGANLTNGILMSSVTENGRDNGEPTGINYCIAFIENQRTNANDTNAIIGAYWIGSQGNSVLGTGAGTGAGTGPEFNVNVAGAYFPYSQFVGGLVRNHGPNDELGQNNFGFTNGGALNQIFGSPGLAIGVNFFDNGSGKYFLTLTNMGIDSRASGVLIVTGAKNESANYGMSGVNLTNGGWQLFLKDNGSTTRTINGYEQDPIAWVFVPKTNTSLISGRFKGDASIDAFSGNSAQFTVTSNAAGVYELKPIGYSATNGVLIISPEVGPTGASNVNNEVSYQANAAGDGWIIQSRDTPTNTLERIPATEAVVSFVFIPGPTPGFSVIPTNNLFTGEDGSTDSFTVVLHKRPTADVTIPVSSSNTAEGTVSTNSLTFTADNWNVPQTVTITGVDDAVIDGTVNYTIVLGTATSADPNWNGLDPADVSVANLDNDSAIVVNPTAGLVTTEAGGTDTFNIHLTQVPSANVTIGLSSSNPNEGTVSPSSLTFTPGNYNVDQPVTVTGVNDFVDDGDKAYTIITAPATSSDSFYSGQNAPDVSVVNVDNDTFGVTVGGVGPTGLSVVEGRTSTYTLVLNSQPSANVTITVAGTNPSQGGTLSPPSVTFTTGNWSNAQTITVTGSDDLALDGNTSWFITNTVSSVDPQYTTIAPISFAATTLDNEPLLTLPSGTLLYGTGLPGVGLDGRAILTDPNTINYNGGSVTVTLTANGTVDDRLEVRNTGTGVGQIGVSGTTVSYGGTTIGSLSGGVGTSPLVISLNTAATPDAVQVLVRNITYRNATPTPPQSTRSFSVKVTHSDTGNSIANGSIRVSLLRYADFQEGLDHGYGIYVGEADCHLRENASGTPFPEGSGGGLFIDWTDPGAHNAYQTLMRFTNIFGTSPGQVPAGAVIVGAELVLTVPTTDANASGDGSPLYRMLRSWDENTDTWDNEVDGVQQDDAESRSAYDSQFGVIDASGSTGFGAIGFSVLPDLQAWQAGDANYGWVMPSWFTATNLDGTTISPGETTVENDRPRLRLLWLPAGVASASYRQNANGYTSVADTQVRPAAPVTSFANTVSLGIDANVTTNDPSDVLIKFDNIIGTGTGQIPPNSVIHGAVLDLASVGNNAMGNGGTFHTMLRPWTATSTWSSLGGIAPNDVDAASAISASAGSALLTPLICGGYHTFELTADVQSWVSGVRANNGWAIFPWDNGGDGWFISSSETATTKDRPQLRVFFTPSLTISSISRGPGSVTINVIGPAGLTGSVQRSTQVDSGYSTIGPITIQPDGTASLVDNSPPPGQAFYRIKSP